MTRRRRHLALLGALAIALPCRAGLLPVQQSITIDGSVADWEQVLLNPLNAAWDGEGAAVGCAYSSDRDCSVSGSEHDLARFAWTWDASFFYVRMERYHASAPWAYFQVYADTNYDGLLQTGEPVFMLRLSASGSTAQWERYSYRAISAFGDPLEDAQLRADGYDMPGTVQSVGPLPATQARATPDGLVFEGSMSWADLSLPGPSPMYVHASASSSTNVPASLRDNAGGTDGRRGDTGYRLVSLSEAPSASSGPGQRVRISHRACNEGNIPARFDLLAVSAQGFDITYWRDDDLDGFPDVYLARDSAGDGDLSRARDDLPVAGDTDADGQLDLGVLTAGQCVTFILEQTYPSNANDLVEQIALVMTQQDAPAETVQRLDSVYIGKITIRPDVARVGVAGDVTWLPHVLRNNTVSAERIDLRTTSQRGWSYDFWTDPEADGLPGPSSVLVFDTDGSGMPDLGLTAGEEVAFLVRARIPAGTPSGQGDAVTIQALVQGNVRDSVVDGVTASMPVEVLPDHTRAARDERYGAAGGSIYFPHVVRNAQGVGDTFDLAVTVDVGWPVVLLADPDGDGRPYDSFPLPGSTGLIGPSGGTFPLIVRVDVPVGSTTGSQAVLTVTATSRRDPSLTDSARDEAFAAIVRLYEDAAHVVNFTQAPPCSTAYGEASGLVALSPDYRFVWRAPSGSSVRVTQVQANSLGRAADAYVVPANLLGDGWTVDIQQLQSMTWVTLDTARFDVLEPVVLRALQPTTSPLDMGAPSLTASAQLQNTSWSRSIAGLALRWVVLTPDRTRYLRANGTFAFYSGTEATLAETVTFGAGETLTRFLAVGSPNFPAEGDYVLELWQRSSCGVDALGGRATVRVLDDADRDGLSRAVEMAAGTDPADADTDEDGLPDSADGLTDTDGDGLIDALDCDSDNDLLLDGTEAALFDLPPATDATAGCWRRDAWPGDSTDPHARDTDGGGVPDGIEDADRDGRIDAGETDPNDPADDATADTDSDGLSDVGEALLGTEPLDADTDDDGVLDGDEATSDADGDGSVDALSCDSDGDGLPDGLERGLAAPAADTDLAAGCFVADDDPATTTNPSLADTDGGGVLDGSEDADRDGRMDAGETDPRLTDDDDADGDGLARAAELAAGTRADDADTDDDGVLDGAEATDLSGDGTTDALQCDADGDGLPDGLERGVSAPPADTDTGAGCFLPDGQPASTTDPASADTDGGGVPDGAEDRDRDGAIDADETDPAIAGDDDPDADGLANAAEAALGTATRDADSDDDGVADGTEAADASGDGITDALQCDADGDGLLDGLERGVTSPLPDTDLGNGCFAADADPATTTDPAAADTDGGGIPDAGEDLDRNGRVDAGETNPLDGGDEDPDADGLANAAEDALGTSRRDADSDDDGLSDLAEGSGDADGDTVPDALACDADADGLPDSLESGLTSPMADTDLTAGCFAADTDPITTTDPRDADTDGGGLTDGAEDLDRDGRVDAGENDPNVAVDDGCGRATPGEVTGVRVTKSADMARVTWDAMTDEPCVTYNAYRSTALPVLSRLAGGIATTELLDGSPLGGAPVAFYVVTATTPFGGEGPTGL